MFYATWPGGQPLSPQHFVLHLVSVTEQFLAVFLVHQTWPSLQPLSCIHSQGLVVLTVLGRQVTLLSPLDIQYTASSLSQEVLWEYVAQSIDQLELLCHDCSSDNASLMSGGAAAAVIHHQLNGHQSLTCKDTKHHHNLLLQVPWLPTLYYYCSRRHCHHRQGQIQVKWKRGGGPKHRAIFYVPNHTLSLRYLCSSKFKGGIQNVVLKGGVQTPRTPPVSAPDRCRCKVKFIFLVKW